MKTPDFEAEARYAPLEERQRAVIAPDRSLEVYVVDFDHVDFETEIMSESLGQNARQGKEGVNRTNRGSVWPPRSIARQDAMKSNNHESIREP